MRQPFRGGARVAGRSPRLKVSMIRIGPRDSGHGSSRVSGGTGSMSGNVVNHGSVSAVQSQDRLDIARAAGAGEEPGMADAVEAVGQNVDHDALEELAGPEPLKSIVCNDDNSAASSTSSLGGKQVPEPAPILASRNSMLAAARQSSRAWHDAIP